MATMVQRNPELEMEKEVEIWDLSIPPRYHRWNSSGEYYI